MIDPLLEPFLAERDIVCPGCGYNLRGLRSDRCPECGDELELSLKLVEPRQAPLITGLVGLSSGAGLGGLLLIYAVIMMMSRSMGSQWLTEFVILNGSGFVAHSAALWLWLRYWHVIRRMNPTPPRWLVVTCWAMPLTFIFIFARVIR